ncbi:MAG: DNA polymerase I [Pseudomonadota bacterium]|nr:DNA polymerase I [Pseudomonadota bacterium]
MATLVLVDGSSYLYRAFHALPDLRTSKGEPTGALRGVLSMLRRLVIDDKPDYFAVVFDAPGKTFRDGWYTAYKANRQSMPDDLAQQIAPLHVLVRAHGWPLLMVEGVEADDVIGTLARQAKAAGIDTLISTSDKDLAQLVAPGITLVNTMTNERLDHEGVVAKFGVRPDQIIDLLTLTGDAVDNVPGVAKVGAKTAAKWLAQYESLDNLIARAHEVGGVVGENLRNSLDWLPQGKRLLTVKIDCELPSNAVDLTLGEPALDQLHALYERFEFKSWLRDLGRTDAAVEIAPKPTANGDHPRDGGVALPRPTVAAPAVEYEMVLTAHALDRWLARIAAAERVSVDIETTSADPMTAEIIGIALSTEATRAAYVPLGHRYAGVPVQLDRREVLDRLGIFFADSARAKLGQNLKFIEHALANHGIALRGAANDTSLQSYVLESHKPHDLASLALRHLDLPMLSYDAVTGKGAHRIPFAEVAVERATEYAAEDADIALRLHDHLFPQIERDEKLRFIYETIELPVREVLFRMERSGVLVDAELLVAQSRELGDRAQALEAEAHRLAGTPFNLGSPRQLCEILYERMKLPVKKKTATGQPSTDEDVLQELAADYPLPKVLLEYRALTKLKSTYTDKLPAMINPRTGRVHTTFAQATAVTGRLASAEPNVQNIPVRTAEGRRIREAFIAPPGHTIISADYSQIELRIMAHLSEDSALLAAFHAGADIHRVTAAEIFSVAPEDVSADQRRYIKAVNFGLIYGMSAFGLATQLNIERAAAQQFIGRYFARYPGVAAYMQRTREIARERGYVETVFGRRLFLPDIRAASGPRRAGAERAAINAPMQGTAADLIKLAMIAVQDYLDRERLRTQLILQVHDELVFEAPDDETPQILRDLPELMNSVATLRVPLKVDVGHGPNWEKAH